MNFQNILDKLELPSDISEKVTNPSLSWEKQSAGYDIFTFHNSDNKPVTIGDDADYLKLFMAVAKRIFQKTREKNDTYLCACGLGGEQLFVKKYEEPEKEQFKYSYIAISNSLKKLPEKDQPLQLNFFAELTFQDADDPGFEKESQKVAKILKGENKDDWQVIVENKFNFLKTDMYIFTLLRLYSWGFQAIKPGDEIDPKQSMVRPVKPKPRGAIRTKRSNQN